MRITNKVMFCDNCNRQIELYEHGYRRIVGWIYPVETTKGRKMLCWKCLQAFNVLERLPSDMERNMSVDSLQKRKKFLDCLREREKTFDFFEKI